MKREDIKHISETEIINAYAKLCIEQSEAMDREEQKRINLLFWKINTLEDELKSNPGDQRRILIRLYAHENIHVRLKAAQATLATNYASARQEIEAIASSRIYPQAADAGMTLENLDSGFYRPT